jgi:hypothetical protein
MPKSATLISLAVATVFVSYSAMQFSGVSTALTQKQAASPPVMRPNTTAKAETPRPVAARPDEPVYKSVIRCLSDMDDLLDTVHNAASFAAIKPKLLDRARQQAALAAAHSDQGMTRMGKAAALEMQKAMNRHTESLARAIEAAPGVREFFAKDIAAILTAK